MLQHFINKCKMDRRFVLKLSLKIPLGISCSLTKKVKYFGFFKREVVIINMEFSSHLSSLVLKVEFILLDSD